MTSRRSTEAHSSERIFRHLGGTIHLTPWVMVLAGSVLIWMIFATGGPNPLQSPNGWFFLAFGLLGILIGALLEWTLRDQPGRIVVRPEGLVCTLPWGRTRVLRWEDIVEVRCTGRRFTQELSFWEIRGRTPKERVTFAWELKGYKELLRTIQQRATSCEHFDPIE